MLGKKTRKIARRKSLKPNLYTMGLTNKTDDLYYIFFADYDECNLSVVEDDAIFLQRNYDMGSMIIVSSSEDKLTAREVYGNYHLIGLSKLKFPEVKECLSLCRCDSHFKQGWRYQFRCWVLRLQPKVQKQNNRIVKDIPRLVSVMPHPSERLVSSAHLKFFELYYNFKLKQKHKLDKGKTVELINYETR